MSLHSHLPCHLPRMERHLVLLSEDIRPGDHPLHQGQALHIPKKSVSHPPVKKARVSGLVDPSEPPQPRPSTTESRIPSGMIPEVIIRRPMVTKPPIKGNLDCRDRPFHSKLCFDKENFRHHPELRDSFHLLQRYHLEHLMTPRDFFYP